MARYSAWKIWFHPRVTSRVLSDYEDAITTLQKEREGELESVGNLVREKESFEKRCVGLEATNEDLDRKLNAAGIQLAQMQDKLKQAEEELAWRKEAEEQIAAFEEMLGKVEAMKARYEKRIQGLRRIIADMNKASGGVDPEALELREIKLEMPSDTKDKGIPSGSGSVRENRPDTDWLVTLD